MTMRHLFRKEVKEAVEDKYGDELVYEALRVPSQWMMTEARTFALWPCELYYHVLFTIDDIRSRNILEAQRYCDKALWDDIMSDIIDKVEECDVAEVNNAVGMIFYGTAMMLIWSGKTEYTSIAGVLMEQVEMYLDGPYMICEKFKDGFSIPDATALRRSIAEYLDSDRELSAEIDELIVKTPYPSERQWQTEMPAKVRVAGEKESSVLVVLEAMYKAGWLVDENGKKLTNRDNALKHIMKTAFGKDNSNVRQLISSVKNRNKAKSKQSIFDELLEQI